MWQKAPTACDMSIRFKSARWYTQHRYFWNKKLILEWVLNWFFIYVLGQDLNFKKLRRINADLNLKNISYRKWIQIIVCYQIWFQVFFEKSNTPQNIIGVVINIDRSTQVIHRQTVILIDHNFFLICAAHGKIRNILFTPNIWPGTQCYTTKNTVYKKI